MRLNVYLLAPVTGLAWAAPLTPWRHVHRLEPQPLVASTGATHKVPINTDRHQPGSKVSDDQRSPHTSVSEVRTTVIEVSDRAVHNGRIRSVTRQPAFSVKAGDRSRTDDIQLGNRLILAANLAESLYVCSSIRTFATDCNGH